MNIFFPENFHVLVCGGLKECCSICLSCIVKMDPWRYKPKDSYFDFQFKAPIENFQACWNLCSSLLLLWFPNLGKHQRKSIETLGSMHQLDRISAPSARSLAVDFLKHAYPNVLVSLISILCPRHLSGAMCIWVSPSSCQSWTPVYSFVGSL